MAYPLPLAPRKDFFAESVMDMVRAGQSQRVAELAAIENQGEFRLGVILMALLRQDDTAAVEVIIQGGANVHHGNNAPLYEVRSYATLRVLLRAAAGSYSEESKNKALIAACKHGYVDVVEGLVEVGAYMHIWDECPLRTAAGHGKAEVVKFLVERGASINATNDDGNPRRDALTRASCLKSGFDGDRTPLEDRQAVVEVLLSAGAWSRNQTFYKFLVAHLPRFVFCLQRQHFLRFPYYIKAGFIRLRIRLRLRMRRVLQRARDRLDHPPRAPLGKSRPTRHDLAEHLRTGGRRFAREYWTDGAPLFFPGIDFGPVPDEFVFRVQC